MRKFLVAALSTVIVVVTLAVVTAVWDRNASDKRAQSARQAIESVIPADRATNFDVHGQPHLLYQLMDMNSTVYVDVKPSGQATHEQFIINDVKDNSYGNFSQYIRFPDPEGTPKPVPNADGSYTNKGTLNGAEKEYSVAQETIPAGGNLVIRDQTGREVVNSPLGSSRTAHVGKPFVTDQGISVEVQYDAAA
ncbi:hypothetical protein [uncultured Kocuria sp.]|uniref:hypothetical protein n=1 Tax=uncultured Kocuria sp. TaxID=259305 RepID=UPI0025945BC7|nr:hypothetical protein [uncultured Kocuria sp.]MCT1368031.1 hypothetical protein [Rothia sp. p3-SID1597]